MNYSYLIALLVSFVGMIVVDKRFALAYFYDRRATLLSVIVGVAVFILWDIIGIVRGIFFSGQSPYMSGIYLGPEFPIEEIIFLTFLCYFTLIMYRIGQRYGRIFAC